MWVWLAVRGPGGVTRCEWTGNATQQRYFTTIMVVGCPTHVWGIAIIMVHLMRPVLWKRGNCVVCRRLQQDVSTSKRTGKDFQQRLSFSCARYEASASAKEETVFYVSSGGFM